MTKTTKLLALPALAYFLNTAWTDLAGAVSTLEHGLTVSGIRAACRKV